MKATRSKGGLRLVLFGDHLTLSCPAGTSTRHGSCTITVAAEGLEPSRPYGPWLLRPVRLPIPPRRDAPGRIRTCTVAILSRSPLPLGYEGLLINSRFSNAPGRIRTYIFSLKRTTLYR